MGPGLSPASAPLGLRRARVTATLKRLEAQARPYGLSAQGRPGEGPLPARTDTQPLAHSGKSPRAFCSAPAGEPTSRGYHSNRRATASSPTRHPNRKPRASIRDAHQ